MNEHQIDDWEPTAIEAFVIERRPEMVATLRQAIDAFYPGGYDGRPVEFDEEGADSEDFKLTLKNTGLNIVAELRERYAGSDPYPFWIVQATRVIDCSPHGECEAEAIDIGRGRGTEAVVRLVLSQMRSDEAERWVSNLYVERTIELSKQYAAKNGCCGCGGPMDENDTCPKCVVPEVVPDPAV